MHSHRPEAFFTKPGLQVKHVLISLHVAQVESQLAHLSTLLYKPEVHLHVPSESRAKFEMH